MSQPLTPSNNAINFQATDPDWTFRTNGLGGREEHESTNSLIKSSFYGFFDNDNGTTSAPTDVSFASNLSSGDSGIELGSTTNNTMLSSTSNDSSGLGSPSYQLGELPHLGNCDNLNTSCYSPFSRTNKEPLLLKIRPSSPIDNAAFNTTLFPHLNHSPQLDPPRGFSVCTFLFLKVFLKLRNLGGVGVCMVCMIE